MAQKQGQFDGLKFECGGISYTLQATSTGLSPDHKSRMSLNMTRIFIKLDGDDNWYGCEGIDIDRINERIEKMGSPLAYILSLGYNEIYHYLYRRLESLDSEENKVEASKLKKLTSNIEELHGTCSNIES